MEMYKRIYHYTSQLQVHDALGDMYVDLDLADTAKQKFMVTHTILTKYDILPKVIHNCNNFCYDSTTAKDLRTQGNNYFMAKRYYAAIESYTQSLMSSEPGSECWAYALANRSAALFHIKYYHKCLMDVSRALKAKYPASLMFKLYERAGHAERLLGHEALAKRNYNDCLKYLDQASMTDNHKYSFQVKIESFIEMCETFMKGAEPEKKEIVDEVLLLGGKNECIPALSNYLELKSSINMGRGVYATHDINPGDVVAIDEPYICQPFPGIHVCYRSSCLKLSVAIIPCPKCLIVVYCDEECMEKAYEEHKVICPIMCSISRIPGNRNINKLVMKWFLRECSQMGLEKFCALVDQLSMTKIDPETRGFDENGLYKSDNFFTAYTLNVGENKLSMDEVFFFNCICVEMIHFLMLSGFNIPECYLATVGASFVHMLRILDVNCLKMNIDGLATTRISDHSLFSTIGFLLYPSVCLFNHSCDANVLSGGRIGDKRSILRAVQPIPKGNQLFISYGTSFKFYNKNSRGESCLDFFMSKCYCQPCLENWPIERYFPNRLSLLNIINPDDDKISKLSSACDKFIELKKTLHPRNIHQHLNYLYYFLKLLFTNVKRPFALYEECVELIYKGHLCFSDEETNLVYNFYNKL